jgi:hypothetical protein
MLLRLQISAEKWYNWLIIRQFWEIAKLIFGQISMNPLRGNEGQFNDEGTSFS